MRSWILAAALALAWPASSAIAQGGPPRPQPRPPTADPPAATPRAANEEARRLEEERYKRWNERMRRATRSLCDRC